MTDSDPRRGAVGGWRVPRRGLNDRTEGEQEAEHRRRVREFISAYHRRAAAAAHIPEDPEVDEAR